MKVTSMEGSSKKTVSKIDLEIDELPPKIQREIKQEVGELIVEQVLMALGDAESLVDGESFPKLSKNYKKKKVSEGGSSAPDLELTGGLKDALTFRPTDDGIEVGFFGKKADHADGHLKFSGRENATPQRRFLPGEGQKFNSDLVNEINAIIADKTTSVFKKSDFSGVESRSDLYDILGEQFKGMSRSEIRAFVASNPELLDMLYDLDLVRFL